MLYGRARESAAIDGLVDRARSGAGGGLMLRGEPGIGKSALLGYAAEHADEMRVLRTAGVEPEADLGYATLHRLLLPVLGAVDRLPEPQRRALGVVFGRATGPAPDRFLVALATLSLLSETACEGPLLCLVDDAHWADAPSLDALAFLARRLDAEPIAVVLAARADEGRPLDGSGLVDLALAGLDREAAVALLASWYGDRLSPGQRDDLLRATGGNPLALRELPAAAFAGVGEHEPLPLAGDLQRAFQYRVHGYDAAARQLLLLVAADGTGRLDTVRRAASVLGDEDADPSGLDELVAVEGATVGFRHPLMRSAVYHGAFDAERRAAHRALAAAVDACDEDRRAWHLGQAADGPDERVAAELERSAERATRRAGPAAAAVALVRAAELSEDDDRRTRRLTAAATAWWEGGDRARAEELLERAELVRPLADDVRLDVAGLRALIELRSGTPADAVSLLLPVLPVLPDTLDGAPDRALHLLMLLGEATFHADAAEAWTEVAALAERLDPNGDEPEDVLFRLFRAACRVRAGADPGLAPGDIEAAERFTDPGRLGWVGGLMWGLGEHDLSRRLRREAVRHARALGAEGVLASALDAMAYDEMSRSRFGSAEAYAEEGLRFAVETRQPNMACRYRALLATLAALRGREDETRELAAEVLAEATGRQLLGAAAGAYRALGLLDLSAGRYAEATVHLDAIVRGGAAHPGLVLGTIPDLVEVAVRAGHPERVAGLVDRLEGWSRAANADEARGLAGRCRALLASGAEAEKEYLDALHVLAGADRPLEHARTALLLGEHLRRERRRSAARPYLRTALETFRRLGTPLWAERAEDELRATGETARRREPSTLTDLTPQERRIAAAVGEGLTNREVAAQLFLSPRTIDYHLRKVFQKLGVSSRTELVRLAVTDDD